MRICYRYTRNVPRTLMVLLLSLCVYSLMQTGAEARPFSASDMFAALKAKAAAKLLGGFSVLQGKPVVGRGGFMRSMTGQGGIAHSANNARLLQCAPKQVRIQSGLPNANGCGLNDTERLTAGALFSILRPCCDGHDYSYSVCGADRKTSDSMFGKCSSDLCGYLFGTDEAARVVYSRYKNAAPGKQPGAPGSTISLLSAGLQLDLTGSRAQDLARCRKLGDRMHSAVVTLGDSAYITSQNEICACSEAGSAVASLGARLRSYLLGLHNQVIQSAGTSRFVLEWATLKGFMAQVTDVL